MTEDEFKRELEKIYDRANDDVVELVNKARDESADGWFGNKPVAFADYPNWQRTADGFALLCGWMYDRLHGRNYDNKKNMIKKIRKALGYTYP